MADEGLVLDRVDIRLAGRRLLALDATVPPGEIHSVMGPSGSGKSTLLAFLGGFLDPAFTATGGMRLDGRDITALPPERRRVGLMFQDALLFPHLSVGGNLLFALPRHLKGRAARLNAAADMLEQVGMAGFADRDPATLSGGQQARVALARTLLAEPRALCLDEAFSRLDTGLRAQVRGLVFDLVRQRRIPAILVTHDRSDAEAAGGTITDLAAGPA